MISLIYCLEGKAFTSHFAVDLFSLSCVIDYSRFMQSGNHSCIQPFKLEHLLHTGCCARCETDPTPVLQHGTSILVYVSSTVLSMLHITHCIISERYSCRENSFQSLRSSCITVLTCHLAAVNIAQAGLLSLSPLGGQE